MELMAAASSSEASPSAQQCAYEVFLSFGSIDTCKSFTDHLYTALVQAGIHTFRDDNEVVRGENIHTNLQTVIALSKVAIIVLSNSHASSRWCLDELAMIMERRSVGLIVIPVFYNVCPSEVIAQSSSYTEAFAAHMDKFGEDRVRHWRAALRGVADLAGMVLEHRHEAQFIKGIVKEVVNRLNRKSLHVSPYLVGRDFHLAEINSWLQDESADAKVMIICGIGGIGKTTIAKIVYNLNYRNFQSSSFLANINRKTAEQPSGLLSLQNQLLSDILKVKPKKIYSEDEGIIKIKDAICCRKVLIVLDDVDELEQFNAIIGMRSWLSPGSKLIVTSRCASVLNAAEDCRMLKVGILDGNESLELFCLHAFEQLHPPEDFVEVTRSAVNYCCGLPLALQVLGSSLHGKDADIWGSALKEMVKIPHCTIQKILRMSYDSLLNDDRKSLFLDIVCFFVGMHKDRVSEITDGCGYYSKVGIQDLTDKCLIAIDEENRLTMHQLIRDMGREIVREESPEDPGKRSRVWDRTDAFQVLHENRGTESITGISLDVSMLEQNKHAKRVPTSNSEHHYQEPGVKRRRFGFFSWQPIYGPQISDENINTEAFAKMHQLKLLQLKHVELKGDYQNFPRSLVWLFWRRCPLDYLPDKFFLNNLVVLDMRHSSLKQLWKGTRYLPKLKIIDLSHSHLLVMTPDFNGLPHLERLILEDCTSLVEIGESIGCLQRIVLLNLRDCKNLKKLPSNIARLDSLEELVLCGCSTLDVSPIEEVKPTAVGDGIVIDPIWPTHTDTQKHSLLPTTLLPSSLRSWLSPSGSPQSSSFSFASLPRFLVRLSLSNCNILDDHIPSELSFSPGLQHLDLSFNPIHKIPESIHRLKLQTLRLERCKNLQSLPALPASLLYLNLRDCTSLDRIANLPTFIENVGFNRQHCENLVEIGGLFKLQPATNIDIEMINKLTMLKLETFGNDEVEMACSLTRTSRTSPPQVLHEFGIFSFFLSGSNIPDWYSYQEDGSSISLHVPVSTIGLNFCAVYTLDHPVINHPGNSDKFDFPVIRIENTTQNLDWTYTATFFEIPSVCEDKRWFSHLSFGNQFEVGDEVRISVKSCWYRIKKYGIHFAYGQQMDGCPSITTSSWYRMLADADVSQYQFQPGHFFFGLKTVGVLKFFGIFY